MSCSASFCLRLCSLNSAKLCFDQAEATLSNSICSRNSQRNAQNRPPGVNRNRARATIHVDFLNVGLGGPSIAHLLFGAQAAPERGIGQERRAHELTEG